MRRLRRRCCPEEAVMLGSRPIREFVQGNHTANRSDTTTTRKMLNHKKKEKKRFAANDTSDSLVRILNI